MIKEMGTAQTEEEVVTPLPGEEATIVRDLQALTEGIGVARTMAIAEKEGAQIMVMDQMQIPNRRLEVALLMLAVAAQALQMGGMTGIQPNPASFAFSKPRLLFSVIFLSAVIGFAMCCSRSPPPRERSRS